MRKKTNISLLDYQNAHIFIRAYKGKATHCEINKRHKARFFHWANISRQYKYDIDDWIMLCPTCHRTFDDWKLTIEELKKIYRKRDIIYNFYRPKYPC